MTLQKCHKCGDMINSDGKDACLDLFTNEVRLGEVHDCSKINEFEIQWFESFGADIDDEHGIHGTKIWNNSDKIPDIVDCNRCGKKIALMENCHKEVDYYELDSRNHFCIIDCKCGVRVFYHGPDSTFAINLDDHHDHRCRLEITQ